MTPAWSLFADGAAQRAARILARRDPRLAELARAYGPPRLPPRRPGGVFGFLATTVIYQQIGIPAARAITRRALAVAGERGRFTPRGILAAGPERLREAGLSRTKAGTLVELARRAARGRLALHRLARADDATIMREVTALPGFGPWSAQMLLIFHLGRPDVFPASDLGIRHGLRALAGLPALPSPREGEALADAWRPYRTVAALWLWTSRSGRAPAIV
ncbi:MAG: DNA-3-methyladenine glycosylase [Acidobacteriota bacterium]